MAKKSIVNWWEELLNGKKINCQSERRVIREVTKGKRYCRVTTSCINYWRGVDGVREKRQGRT